VFVPDKTRVLLVPVFTRVAPTPEMTPVNVPVAAAARLMVPVVLRAMLLAAEIPDATVNVVPLPIERAPVPSPALLARSIVPRERVVPPE
jgi:hypothetical protein